MPCTVGQPPVIVGQPDCYTWLPSGQPPSNHWQALTLLWMQHLCHGGAIYTSECTILTNQTSLVSSHISFGKRGGGSEYGATYDLCMRLMDRYKNRSYHLYVDNFYTSPILFSDLYEQGTGACGTLRVNRKHVPDSIKKGNPAMGNQIVVSNGPLMVIKFHDGRQVTLCSTIHKGCMVDTGKKTRDTQEPILKPDVVLDYNKHLGNVDRGDQLVQYLAMRRRTLKWYKKVLFHMMDLCTVQAYIIYKMVTNKPILHRVFKRELVKEILASTELPRAISSGCPRATAPETLQRLNNDLRMHYLDKIVGTGKANISRARVVCSTSERKLMSLQGMVIPKRPGCESSFECVGCSSALCVTPCFMIYHTCAYFFSAYRRWKEAP